MGEHPEIDADTRGHGVKVRFDELQAELTANVLAIADLLSDIGFDEAARAQQKVAEALHREGRVKWQAIAALCGTAE